MLDLYAMEIRFASDADQAQILPFLASGDRQAVADALAHVDVAGESGLLLGGLRVTTLSIGAAGEFGTPGVIEAPRHRLVYEWDILDGVAPDSLLSDVPGYPGEAPPACPACGRAYTLVSSSGDYICSRADCD